MLKLSLVLFVLISNTAFCQIPLSVELESSTISQSNDTTYHHIESISKKVNSTIVVVGYDYQKGQFPNGSSHIILRSDNNGISWIKQQSSLPNFSLIKEMQMRKVCVIDSMHQFIVGDSGLILSTTDAGTTWKRQIVNTSWGFRDVTFVDKDNGIAVGQAGTIATTTNGGESWDVKEKVYGSVLNKCFSFPPATYYVFTEFFAKMLKSYDGGLTWDTLSVFEGDNTGWNYKGLNDEVFLDSLHGFAVGGQPDSTIMGGGYKSLVVETTDGGNKWEIRRLELDRTLLGLNSIDFLTEQRGVATCHARLLLLTEDGGKTWKMDTISSPVLFVVFGNVRAISDKHFFVEGSNGFYEYLLKGTFQTNEVSSLKKDETYLPFYPNPFTHSATVHLPLSVSGTAYFYDVLGREMYSIPLGYGGGVVTASTLSTGMYRVVVKRSDGITQTLNILKE